MKTKLVRVSDSGMTTSEDLSKLLTLLSVLNTLSNGELIKVWSPVQASYAM